MNLLVFLDLVFVGTREGTFKFILEDSNPRRIEISPVEGLIAAGGSSQVQVIFEIASFLP